MEGSLALGRTALGDEEHISLCETLDRVLNKGVVIAGEIVISVADIDLVYLGLQLVLTSVETANRVGIRRIFQSAGKRSVDHERLYDAQN